MTKTVKPQSKEIDLVNRIALLCGSHEKARKILRMVRMFLEEKNND